MVEVPRRQRPMKLANQMKSWRRKRPRLREEKWSQTPKATMASTVEAEVALASARVKSP